MIVLKILGLIVLFIAVVLVILSNYCFDDNDPDMDWYNSQK